MVDVDWQPRGAGALRRPRRPPEQDGADLVIAESLAVASAAIAAGTPKRRLWLLVRPPRRLVAGDPGAYARSLAGVAARVGGLLTDSEPDRESVERAASALRPRVEIFPPVAVDQPCPSCGSSAGSAPDGAAPGASPGASPVPGGCSPAIGSRLSWGGGLTEPLPDLDNTGTSAGTGEWTSQAQVRAARRMLDAATPQAPHQHRRTRRVLVTGFDLKFAVDLADRLDHRPDLDVTVDEWPDLARATTGTYRLTNRADSVVAEWARPSAVRLSRRKRPGRFLVVRLHRYELDSPYPRDIVIENVDAVVYIAPLFGRRIRDELGWPVDKLAFIPNYVDLDWLARPKLPGARFTLGLVGMEVARKRFDLALDLLAALRREDPRFTLVVRSVMPWNNQYVWGKPDERAYAGWCFERIERDPLLRTGVIFDAPGRDMARWYRRVGHVLSTSDEEGSHTALAERMGSGAVPVIRPWPGAGELYAPEWIHPSTDAAAAAVLEAADADRWQQRAARAGAEIRRTHDPASVVAAWADLLHGDLAGARAHFAAYASLQPVTTGAGGPEGTPD